jgi:predicted metal-dependent phosphoesterase TrpH
MSVSHSVPAERLWIKADFHLHCAEDPLDAIEHSATDLVERAVELGFGALGITLHDAVLERPELVAAARAAGLLLIPAVELRLEGADVVVLNITGAEAARLKTFADLRAWRAERGEQTFVFAPHPFYVIGGSIGPRLMTHIDCFDAIEFCHFHTRWFSRNEPAVRAARRYGKPLLATSDVHHLAFFGDHYTLIEVPPSPQAADIFAALRTGRTRLVSPPWPVRRFLAYLFYIFVTHPWRLFLERLAR